MIRIFYFILFIFIYQLGYAQTGKKDLLNEREQLFKDIKLTNTLLESNTSKQGSTLNNIKLLDSKIANKNSLINNYYAEISIIENKIVDRNATIESLEKELVIQKEKYAEFLRFSYKNSSKITTVMYLLASENLNQFYLRRKYLEQLNDARKEKIELIVRIDQQIQYEIAELTKAKTEIGEIILTAEQEKKELSSSKKKRNEVLAELTNEEKRLKEELANKEKVASELTKKIEELIRAEAKKDKFAVLTPEQKLVSSNFEKNRGKLPWPTAQGIITEPFGEHGHITLRGVKVRNNGVDITTLPGTEVRSIFNGEVSKIFSIKGSNYTVIVRHGTYYTVYHNLINVSVEVGDALTVKQRIGEVGSSANTEPIVHLEIWKGMEKLNPEYWISN